VNKLRIAVVGAGRLGGFHAQKLARLENVELVAVADPAAGPRERLAAECGCEAAADHRQLIGRVEGVVIAAPTRLHHELGLDFLRAGVHVLMEKPLAVTAAEADELVSAAQQHGAILQVGHVERFNPAFSAVVPYVRCPKYIEAVRSSGFTFRSLDVGVVLDLMIHDLDLVLSMVRSPLRRVDALGLSLLGGYEDVANARLEFQSGCVAVLSACRVSHAPERRMSLWSPRGFGAVDFATRTMTTIRPSDSIAQRHFDAGALSGAEVEHFRQHLLDEHFPRQQQQFDAVDALTLELEDFVDSIRQERPPQVTGEQGREAVAAAEQILAAIAAHRWEGAARGPVGPLATPRPSIIPAPHWQLRPAVDHRRQAG
jgi:predicted dehydrogenase